MSTPPSDNETSAVFEPVRNPMPMAVPSATPISSVANRADIARRAGPVRNCHALVASVGMTMSVAASTGGMNKLSSPSETAGRPMPKTPLTNPAQNKLSAIHTNVAVLSVLCRARF
jgi:hypothetical protein